MKTNHLFTSLLVLILTLVLSGCASMSTKSPTDLSCTTVDMNAMLDSGIYQKKAENFLIIQDATLSMNESLDLSARLEENPSKIEISRGLIKCMNNSISGNIDLKAGLSTFGSVSSANGLVYGMSDYSKAGLEDAVLSIKKNDFSMANKNDPFTDAGNALKQVSGRTAVILLSDGWSVSNNPVASAAAFKKMYGNDVCIYTILLGNEPVGKTTMEAIATEGGCGFATDANNLYLRPLKECDTVNVGKGMGDFVASVFLEMDDDRDGVGNSIDECPNTPLGVAVDKVGCPIDSDGDGVPDYLDKCPDTPVGVKVDEMGCPIPDIDSDGDGVFDLKDRCPDTPKGIEVDEAGCPIPLLEKVTVTLYVGFDFDKAKVKSLYREDLEKVGNLLNAYPKTSVDLEGFADSTGPEEYNMNLSIRRAESVKGDLVENYNIDASRILTNGYGETRPAASNDTVEGRQENRRVVAIIEAVIE
jgi:OOP family OmpA-OmpF porin